jgi:7-cyano-7-deazaguanine synthase
MTDPRSHSDAIGLLLSGGLDSSILLDYLASGGRRVRPFYVRCRTTWDEAEQRAVAAVLEVVGPTDPLVVFEMPLGDLYGEHWSLTGQNVPQADTPDEAVYLPGRNIVLAVKPALWCAMHGIEELALAVLKTNPFADATDDFFRELGELIGRSVGRTIRLSKPFGRLTKQEVMERGRNLPLERTFSCIAPITGRHCGRCNKCAERKQAFRSIALEDLTEYV